MSNIPPHIWIIFIMAAVLGVCALVTFIVVLRDQLRRSKRVCSCCDGTGEHVDPTWVKFDGEDYCGECWRIQGKKIAWRESI
jgi:hypothetical protein